MGRAWIAVVVLVTGCGAAAEAPERTDGADAGPGDAAQAWIDAPLRGPYGENRCDAQAACASWVDP